MAGGAGSALGRGGMLTKVQAAKKAALSGSHTIIAYGRETKRAGPPARGRGHRHAPVSEISGVQSKKDLAGGEPQDQRQSATR